QRKARRRRRHELQRRGQGDDDKGELATGTEQQGGLDGRRLGHAKDARQASSRPATKAPSAMESPARLAITAVPTMTNNVAATNSSLVPVAATSRNSGRSSSRPTATIIPVASAAWARASRRLEPTAPPLLSPRIDTKSRIGTTAKSWANRMEKLARPAAVARRR